VSRTPKIDLHAEIAALSDLDLDTLQAKWRELYGVPTPKKIRRDFLRRAIAYGLQEREFGGLSPALRRRLARLAEGLEQDSSASASAVRQLRPGMRLMREWKGKTHVVDVTQKGFRWRGQTFRSLSSVACTITGARWSGPRFFGIGGPKDGKTR
jgi:hypothetical protein